MVWVIFPFKNGICDGNLADNWVEFQEDLVSWSIAEKRKAQHRNWQAVEVNEVEGESVDKFAVGEFVSFLGRDGRAIFRTLFPAPADLDLASYYESLRIKDVLKVFDGHCQRNDVAETLKFHQLRQRSGEPFNEYLTRVRVQVVKCKYKCTCGASTEERAIRDQMVTGVALEELQKKLLSQNSATTEDIIRIGL